MLFSGNLLEIRSDSAARIQFHAKDKQKSRGLFVEVVLPIIKMLQQDTVSVIPNALLFSVYVQKQDITKKLLLTAANTVLNTNKHTTAEKE